MARQAVVRGRDAVPSAHPLAADIATLSADHLFGEAPSAVLPGERRQTAEGEKKSARDEQQERVERVINTARFHSTLLESGEVAAALGGSYLRLVWNQERLKTVRAEIVHADAAIPTFRLGDLAEVTFWSELDNSANDSWVWRHPELHPPGRIERALTRLQRRARPPRPRRPAPRNRMVPEVIDGNSEILTGVAGLTAAYVPNKHFRKQSHLSRLGQSDFADILGLLDAVDETWSSWTRHPHRGGPHRGREAVPPVGRPRAGRDLRPRP